MIHKRNFMQNSKVSPLWQWVLTGLLLVMSNIVMAQERAVTKVLFIGNSYSYYNSLSQQFESMTKSQMGEGSVQTHMVSGGALTLKKQWQDGKALAAIKSQQWDYVVLQEQSMLGSSVRINGVQNRYFYQYTPFFEHARLFDQAIKAAGAKTVFYLTWSRESKPQQQKYLTYAYMTIAKELNAMVAPVGLVWDKVRAQNSMDLYVSDGSHPTPLGTYLAASTIYSTVFDTDSSGISGKLDGFSVASSGDMLPGKVNLTNLTKSQADTVHHAVTEVRKTLSKTDGILTMAKPVQEYTEPTLAKGVPFNPQDITGSWYGKTAFRYRSTGIILDIHQREGKWEAQVRYVMPEQTQKLIAQMVTVNKDTVVLTFKNSIATTQATFSLNNKQLTGLSQTTLFEDRAYDDWQLTRDPIQQQVDLNALVNMVDALTVDATQAQYVKQITAHYEQYSKMIGREKKPSEGLLNYLAYQASDENKVATAVNYLSLAITYYPQSANAHDSLAEVLAAGGQQQKATKMYQKAVELAEQSNDPDLAGFQRRLASHQAKHAP
jgi:hypothetical protein